MAYYLTADGGTESLRARIYDLDGACLGSKAVPYETRFSPGARAEQNPEDWWQALIVATRGAIAESGISAGQIEAMAYATTCCTVVALDDNGMALRPALLWMDVRAHTRGRCRACHGRRAALSQRRWSRSGIGRVDDSQSLVAEAQRTGNLQCRPDDLRVSGLPHPAADGRSLRIPG